jgi:predicted nucleotide-binding protein
MPISHADYSFRANQLHYLDFQDATPRLIGFVEWLETDENAGSILRELRERDLDSLLKGCGYNTPPKPKSAEEVAAIALCMIDTCKERNTDLFQIGMAIGVHASSSHIQDNSDEIVTRYIVPLLEFIEMRLFSDARPEFEADMSPSIAMNTTDVFVVHGCDEAAKQIVARFLEKLGLNPVILHEQSNRGRTIIEKFEDHAEVRFAVIILTPDDIGRLATESESSSTLRARQNVIFEMGYFIGRIGRGRVFPLRRGSVEIPSDYSGVVYTELDDKGAWRVELVRELKGAGFVIDANKAFE